MPDLSDAEREHLITGVSPLLGAMVEAVAKPKDTGNPIVDGVAEGFYSVGAEADVDATENASLRAFLVGALEKVLDEYKAGLDTYMHSTYGSAGH